MKSNKTVKTQHQAHHWWCPKCRGKLEEGPESLYCDACDNRYEMIGGIPDLRLPGTNWLDHEADRQQAQTLWEQSQNMTLEELVRSVYSAQPGRDSKSIELRTPDSSWQVPDPATWIW